jgi:hypothetical protein
VKYTSVAGAFAASSVVRRESVILAKETLLQKQTARADIHFDLTGHRCATTSLGYDETRVTHGVKGVLSRH